MPAMGYRWEDYRDKVAELKEVFKTRTEGGDVEVDVLMPGEDGYSSDRGIPYVRIRYYIDEHFHERRIDLYEYYLKKEIKELIGIIEHFIQEFEMEMDQSEYGGG